MKELAPQMSEENATNEVNCGVCGEVVTQPVCPECLEREMIDWLAFKGENIAELLNFIKETTNIFKAYDCLNTKCVICGKKMRVCAHCYCKEIFDYMNGRYPELEDEFITHFDFNIHFKMRIP